MAVPTEHNMIRPTLIAITLHISAARQNINRESVLPEDPTQHTKSMEDYAVLAMIFIFSFVGLTTYGIQTLAKTKLTMAHAKSLSDCYVATVQTLSTFGVSVMQEMESQRMVYQRSNNKNASYDNQGKNSAVGEH